MIQALWAHPRTHPELACLLVLVRHRRFSVTVLSIYSYMARGTYIFLYLFQILLVNGYIMSNPGQHLTSHYLLKTLPSPRRRRVLSAKGIGSWPAAGPRIGRLTPKLGIARNALECSMNDDLEATAA